MSSTIISLNLNAWMLSGPFQYKSPGSLENFNFKFCGASTKYLLNVSAFRFLRIDLKLIFSGSTDLNSPIFCEDYACTHYSCLKNVRFFSFFISDVILLRNFLKLFVRIGSSYLIALAFRWSFSYIIFTISGVYMGSSVPLILLLLVVHAYNKSLKRYYSTHPMLSQYLG